jgi:hypothetical protein
MDIFPPFPVPRSLKNFPPKILIFLTHQGQSFKSEPTTAMLSCQKVLFSLLYFNAELLLSLLGDLESWRLGDFFNLLLNRGSETQRLIPSLPLSASASSALKTKNRG